MPDIEEILKATIQTKVIEAFNTTPEMIDKLVQAALSKEVDASGNCPSRYLSEREKMPYMDWLVGEEIRRAVTAIVRAHIEEHASAFKEKVKAAMESGDITESVSTVIAQILSEEYRWNVNLDIRKE